MSHRSWVRAPQGLLAPISTWANICLPWSVWRASSPHAPRHEADMRARVCDAHSNAPTPDSAACIRSARLLLEERTNRHRTGDPDRASSTIFRNKRVGPRTTPLTRSFSMWPQSGRVPRRRGGRACQSLLSGCAGPRTMPLQDSCPAPVDPRMSLRPPECEGAATEASPQSSPTAPTVLPT